MLKSFIIALANRLSPPRIPSTRLSVAETEDTITQGARSWTDFTRRENYKRATIIEEAFTAWRTNPIARRIIELQTEFVIGDGFGYEADDAPTKKFIDAFWKHPVNDLDTQLPEFSDEAWRSGDLFILGSVDGAGMTYYRAIPAEVITEIETRPNDYRQELFYKAGPLDERPFAAYDPDGDYLPGGESQNTFVLHFPLNRAIGQSFGESDLATVLYWIKLYRQFIEDRARLNFFRQLFTFVLHKVFPGGQTEKDTYVKDFSARLPKKSGGVLALDAAETIETLDPKLGSFDAGEDGLLIKKMIAVGVGMPMHWLAESEANTRTTAEAAGTPAFRRLKARQKFMEKAVARMINVALEVRRKVDKTIPEKPIFALNTPDITERDNAQLSLAVLRITQAFAPLYNAKKINAKEFIRLVYRFLAETPPDDAPDDKLPIFTSGSTGDIADGSASKEPVAAAAPA